MKFFDKWSNKNRYEKSLQAELSSTYDLMLDAIELTSAIAAEKEMLKRLYQKLSSNLDRNEELIKTLGIDGVKPSLRLSREIYEIGLEDHFGILASWDKLHETGRQSRQEVKLICGKYKEEIIAILHGEISKTDTRKSYTNPQIELIPSVKGITKEFFDYIWIIEKEWRRSRDQEFKIISNIYSEICWQGKSTPHSYKSIDKKWRNFKKKKKKAERKGWNVKCECIDIYLQLISDFKKLKNETVINFYEKSLRLNERIELSDLFPIE